MTADKESVSNPLETTAPTITTVVTTARDVARARWADLKDLVDDARSLPQADEGCSVEEQTSGFDH